MQNSQQQPQFHGGSSLSSQWLLSRFSVWSLVSQTCQKIPLLLLPVLHRYRYHTGRVYWAEMANSHKYSALVALFSSALSRTHTHTPSSTYMWGRIRCSRHQPSLVVASLFNHCLCSMVRTCPCTSACPLRSSPLGACWAAPAPSSLLFPCQGPGPGPSWSPPWPQPRSTPPCGLYHAGRKPSSLLGHAHKKLQWL